MEHESYSIRRRYRRCRFNAKVMLIFDGRSQFCNGLELSEGGMLVVGKELLRVDEPVELNYMLPSGEFVSTNATVIYSFETVPGAYRIGLSFRVLAPTDQKRIARFVDRALSSETE